MANKDLLIVCTDEEQYPLDIMDAAEQLAEENEMGMRVLCVVSADKSSSYAMGHELDMIFERSKQSGADMIVYFTDKKSDIVRSYIRKNEIEEVMTTAGESSRLQGLLRGAGLDVKLWHVDDAGGIRQAMPAMAI